MNTEEVLQLADAVRLARSGEGQAIRLRAQVSQSVIAGACGCADPSVIHRWEHGQRVPSGEQGAAWARLLRQLDADARGSAPPVA